jgi:tRNA 2-thiouridine synthesizing protein B
VTTLHLLYQSPFQSSALARCLRHAAKEDVILLMQDAVIAALSPTRHELETFTVYALYADLKARGLLDQVTDTVLMIDYSEFVRLTVHHSKILSWS